MNTKRDPTKQELQDENTNLRHDLKMARSDLSAQIYMLCRRLGGQVEGNPTGSINYLQRVDELVRIEKFHRRSRRLRKRVATSLAEIEDADVVIRVPIAVMTEHYIIPVDLLDENFESQFLISSANGFARDIVHALNSEREDGSTPVSDLLDNAYRKAIEDGSQHVDYSRRASAKP